MRSTRVVADIRNCEQCGTSFVPRREHARFCSARCRVAWNREHLGDLKAGASALQWSITAMTATAERLPRVRAADLPRAFTVIGEAVWWVTIVDATLVRHHPDAYDRVMTAQAPAQRRRVEEPWQGCALCGTGSATKPILPSSSTPARPARPPATGLSQAGRGGPCQGRRSDRFHRAAGHGKGRGIRPTTISWRAAPSERPSAGPRSSSSWRPRMYPRSQIQLWMPHAEERRPAGQPAIR